MVTLTVTGASIEEVMTLMGGQKSAMVQATGGVVPEKVIEKPAAKKVEKVAEKVAEPTKVAETIPSTAPTVEDIKAIVPQLIAKTGVGRDAVVKLLAEFGAKKGSEVPVEKIGEFMSKAQAMLAA